MECSIGQKQDHRSHAENIAGHMVRFSCSSRASLGGAKRVLTSNMRHTVLVTLASDDGGHSWELLEALLVQHLPQLQVGNACFFSTDPRFFPQSFSRVFDNVWVKCDDQDTENDKSEKCAKLLGEFP